MKKMTIGNIFGIMVYYILRVAGKILGQGYYRNGLRDRKFFSYHDNGTIEYEENFKDGKRIGCSRLFKDDGLLIKEEHF